MSTFFTADLHMSHANIMQYCNRPFPTVHEMNRAITKGIFDRVLAGDTLYILGDISMKSQARERLLSQLYDAEIKVRIAFGNHDKKIVICDLNGRPGSQYGQILETNIGKHPVVLCHYPMLSWNRSSHGSWQLYGHVHGRLEPRKNQLDVGVDKAYQLLGEYRPFSAEEVCYFIGK